MTNIPHGRQDILVGCTAYVCRASVLWSGDVLHGLKSCICSSVCGIAAHSFTREFVSATTYPKKQHSLYIHENSPYSRLASGTPPIRARIDEHRYACRQLIAVAKAEQPDAVVIAGDIYDVATPSAEAEKLFVETILELTKVVSGVTVAAIAGNHDSARRQDAHSPLWERAGVHVVGGIVSNALYDVENSENSENSENIESSNPDTESPCSVLAESDGILREKYIFEVPGRGYIIAVPYANRYVDLGSLCSRLTAIVRHLNVNDLPVVMVGHATVDELVGANRVDLVASYGGEISEVHNDDGAVHPVVGTVEGRSLGVWGNGFDYLALGHIHGRYVYYDDNTHATAAYSGSLLPTSFDQAYAPHGVYIVDIPGRKHGPVTMTFREIKPLRPLVTIPSLGMYTWNQAMTALEEFNPASVSYVRLNIKQKDALPQSFMMQARKAVEERGCRCIISTVNYERQLDDAEGVPEDRTLSFSDFEHKTPQDIARMYVSERNWPIGTPRHSGCCRWSLMK